MKSGVSYPQAPSKATLSEPRQRLVELLQRLNFGHIHNLCVVRREPVLDPLPVVIRELKFGGDNRPRPELQRGNFLLKLQLVDLFELFDRLGQGTIELLEFKNGLPFRALVPEAA